MVCEVARAMRNVDGEQWHVCTIVGPEVTGNRNRYRMVTEWELVCECVRERVQNDGRVFWGLYYGFTPLDD